MLTWFMGLEVWVQALIGTLFTWGLTALGASLVFFFKNIERNIFNLILGFASGVMIAASFWSLLAPAIEMAEEQGVISWIVVAVGFAFGGIFLYVADKLIPHMHLGFNHDKEGLPTKLKRNILLKRENVIITPHMAFDSVEAVERILETTTENINNLEVVKKIIKIMNKDENMIEYVTDRLGHDQRYAIDWSKINKELGWQPHYDFETGLKETVKWYTNNQEWWKKLVQN